MRRLVIKLFKQRKFASVLAVGLMLSFYAALPLYWRLGYSTSEDFEPCMMCSCDCDSLKAEIVLERLPRPRFADSDDNNVTLPDCGKDNPDMEEDLRKSSVQLLQEEIGLLSTVSTEYQQRLQVTVRKFINKAREYQRNHEECSLMVMATEEGRERAEADLVLQRKISHLWKGRARQLGWQFGDITTTHEG